MKRGGRRWALAALALVLVVVAAASCGTIRAGRLLRDALAPAETFAAEVTETEVAVPSEVGAPLRARLVRPIGEEGALPAFLLVHGAHEDGFDHPALVSLARALAIRGATVALIDLPALRRFAMDAGDPGRVAEATAWLAAREDLTEDGRVALFGISVGGSYAIVAAADPRVADHVSAVIAFGAYPDLDYLLFTWMTAPRADAPQLMDPFTQGRRRVLLGNYRGFVPAADHAYVDAALRALLDDRTPPAPPAALGDTARLLVAAASADGPIARADARRLLDHLADATAALSPGRLARAPRAPIHLLHGEGDPVVPIDEAERLRTALEAAGGDALLHVTDLFEHVDPTGADQPGLLEAWPLLRFLAGALGDAGL